MKNSIPNETLPRAGQPQNRELGARTKGMLLMSGAVVAFTASVLLLRSTRLEGNIWLATCIRYGIGLAIVSMFYLPSRQFKPLQLIRNPDLIMRGVLGCTGIFLFYSTIPHLGAGMSTFISTTYVVMAPLMARIHLKEALTLKQVGLMALAMVGMFIMTGMAGASAPPLLQGVVTR